MSIVNNLEYYYPHSCPLCEELVLDYGKDTVQAKRQYLASKFQASGSTPTKTSDQCRRTSPMTRKARPKWSTVSHLLLILKWLKRISSYGASETQVSEQSFSAVTVRNNSFSGLDYHFSNLVLLDEGRERIVSKAAHGCSFFALLEKSLRALPDYVCSHPSDVFLIAMEKCLDEIKIGLALFPARYPLSVMDLHPLWHGQLLASHG